MSVSILVPDDVHTKLVYLAERLSVEEGTAVSLEEATEIALRHYLENEVPCDID